MARPRGPTLFRAVVLISCPVLCNPARAQGPAGADTLSAAAVAESLTVLDSLGRHVRSRGNDAAAWHRRAMIAFALSERSREPDAPKGLSYTDLRLTGDIAFKNATRLAPDSVRYWIDAGSFYLVSDHLFTRAASYGHFEEGLKAARRTGRAPALSDALVNVGRIYWRRYDLFAFRDWQTGEADYITALGLFREAFMVAPDNLSAFHHYAMMLVEQDRWQELEVLARERVRRLPADGWGWMTLGLARQRVRATAEARTAFDRALEHLDERERARLDRFERILSTQSVAEHALKDSAARATAARTGWQIADPLWSEDYEDPRVEFLARITHAELRWTVPERDVRGADTDRGEVMIRYGPPASIHSSNNFGDPGELWNALRRSPHFADNVPTNLLLTEPNTDLFATQREALAGTRATTYGAGRPISGGGGGGGLVPRFSGRCGWMKWTWRYPNGVMFFFEGCPTFATATFQDSAAARRAIDRRPASWDNIALGSIAEMPRQVARFRAGDDSTDVFIAAYAWSDSIRGAVATNARVRAWMWMHERGVGDVHHDSIDVPVSRAIRWESRVAHGPYYFRVEATAPGGLLAARTAADIQAGPDSASGYTTRGFGISDVLLATRAEPRGAATTWRDFAVTPIFDGVVDGNELALVWETYELGRTADRANYHVTITLQRADVAGTPLGRIAAQVAGVLGINRREEPDRVTFEFDREVAHGATLVDNVAISLGATPAGRYTLTLAVTDNGSGREATRALPLKIR